MRLSPRELYCKYSIHFLFLPSPKSWFSVLVKNAMEAKLCLVLMLLFWGTLTVQGQSRNSKENRKIFLDVAGRQWYTGGECSFYPLTRTVCLYHLFL